MTVFLTDIARRLISMGFDPRTIYRKFKGVKYFLGNCFKYAAKSDNSNKFRITFYDAHPCLSDRFKRGGSAVGHYFWQDLWAAKVLYDQNVKRHVDIGSRVDGFISHILPFCCVKYVDIRQICVAIPNFEYIEGSATKMPFESNTISSLSCLHVLEHIGLGRYGDSIDPDGYIKAAREISRVIAEDGFFLLGTPVGRERLCFDAHRVFDPQTIIDLFDSFELEEFSLIDDKGNGIIRNAPMDLARKCDYGCGLYIFRKFRLNDQGD